MDSKRHDAGMAMRRKVLGDAHVDRANAKADDFTRGFQDLVTRYAWGEIWGDDTLPPRDRSILTLGMLAALGKPEEFAMHVHAALRNGLTPAELRAVLMQVGIYCGLPAANECFRIAQPIVAEHSKT